MTHNARPALSKPSGRTDHLYPLLPSPWLPSSRFHPPSSRQLVAGMQHREAIVAL